MNTTIRYTADPADYAWTISVLDDNPKLTSQKCAQHLTEFMHRKALLSVATEASSHPSGLEALYAQPWLWAGGGLGNMDECPLQTCLAGVAEHSSLVYASVCVVPECTAHDLDADDFPATVARASQVATADPILGTLYADTFARTAKVNKYLKTGWTCGEFVVPWRPWPFGVPFLILVALFTTAVVVATQKRSRQRQQQQRGRRGRGPSSTQDNDQDNMETHALLPTKTTSTAAFADDDYDFMDEKKSESATTISTPALTTASSYSTLSYCWRSMSPSSSSSSFQTTSAATDQHNNGCMNILNGNPATTTTEGNRHHDEYSTGATSSSFWQAFDARVHWEKLLQASPRNTAVLDGMRVLSMLWILLGHVMAIVGSTGAGWANPTDILPPHGWTTTWPGQLLFSSRLAVDTFLVLSGFLTVYVLVQKLPLDNNDVDTRPNPVLRYLRHFPGLLMERVVRILPLYAMCLLFFTQVAPKLGGGPFWYQWWALLKPCHDYGWTNLLFINNFWPADEPITNTCFYHSWYLAVDMQLFLAGAILVFWYQARPRQATLATGVLWILGVLLTSVLAALRGWSVNTFDGAAVARYDVEAYAKPWIRSVPYLTGMYLAMILPRRRLQQRGPWLFQHHVVMGVTLIVMACITFGTALGAYARRPCLYQDWPAKDNCGSTWSRTLTWFYTSASRAIWCLCVGVLLHLCLGRSANGSSISTLLSWGGWTPLSHLTFGTYLIHPIVIFVWQLGDHSKTTYRFENFAMTTISVAVVSYLSACLMALTVEFPCAALWRQWTIKKQQTVTSEGPRHSTCSAESTGKDLCQAENKDQSLQVVYGSISHQ